MLPTKSLIVMLPFVFSIPLLAVSESVSAQEMEPTYRAIVKGGPEGLANLKLFHQHLMTSLGVTNLALAEVGCDKCEKLNSGPPEDVLVFYFPRRTPIVLAFTLSWRHVQATNRSSDFSLQMDGEPPPSPACSDHGAGCMPRAACQVTDFCDKPKGGLCNAC